MCPCWPLIAESIFLALSVFSLSLICVYCYLMAQLLLFWRLPFHLDLTLLSFSLDSWVPRAFYDSLWEGHLSPFLYMERFIPFLGSLSIKRSSKRVFYIDPFIYKWTWEAYNLISVFAVYITNILLMDLSACLDMSSHSTHFLWYDNLSIDPGIHCCLVSSLHYWSLVNLVSRCYSILWFKIVDVHHLFFSSVVSCHKQANWLIVRLVV